MSGERHPLAEWRDSVRDADREVLDRTAKLVAFVLSTYMNGAGHAFPGKRTLAAGASLSKRAVDTAIAKLEEEGFLTITHSRGHHRHSYQAVIPNGAGDTPSTVQHVHGYSDLTVHLTTPNRASDDTPTVQQTPPNSAPPAPESIESKKRKPPKATPAGGDGYLAYDRNNTNYLLPKPKRTSDLERLFPEPDVATLERMVAVTEGTALHELALAQLARARSREA
jgi:hypothetical protein